MPSVEETLSAKSQLAADIASGVNILSLDQEVTFTKYIRLVLPLDGFVFWVRADIVSRSALLNVNKLNTVYYNERSAVVTPAATLTVRGSLHYATNQNQNEDETAAVNSVIFTALAEVQDFNQISPSVLFLAELDGFRFAFNQRRPFYRQADTHHYLGNAVYPAMASQIIDNPSQFSAQQVVSNSLPIWLSMRNYTPPYPGFNNRLQLYPSFLVPTNLRPPYVSVHIVPDSTRPLQGTPLLGRTLTHTQLVRETARLTFYGVNNDAAMNFQDCVNQFTIDTDLMGIMNMPVMRDEKRTQSELNVIAMKKSMDYDVNYYQSSSRHIARQLIEEALVMVLVRDAPVTINFQPSLIYSDSRNGMYVGAGLGI